MRKNAAGALSLLRRSSRCRALLRYFFLAFQFPFETKFSRTTRAHRAHRIDQPPPLNPVRM